MYMNVLIIVQTNSIIPRSHEILIQTSNTFTIDYLHHFDQFTIRYPPDIVVIYTKYIKILIKFLKKIYIFTSKWF